MIIIYQTNQITSSISFYKARVHIPVIFRESLGNLQDSFSYKTYPDFFSAFRI